jgi:hypothetical protein
MSASTTPDTRADSAFSSPRKRLWELGGLRGGAGRTQTTIQVVMTAQHVPQVPLGKLPPPPRLRRRDSHRLAPAS